MTTTGVFVQHPDDFRPELASRHVAEFDLGVGVVLDAVQVLVPSVLRQRLAAVHAVLGVGGDDFATVPTPLAFGGEGVVVLDDTGLGEDLLVHLLGRDVDIVLPHVGVQPPVDAMLDFALVVPLAPHPRDGGVPEVVGVRRLVDTGLLSQVGRQSPDPARRERPVGILVLSEFVEESGFGVVGTGMRVPEVDTQRCLAVDERVGFDLDAFEADGVRVRRVGRPFAVKVDVADTEAAHQRQPGARVSEELDDGLVAGPVGRVDERSDVLLREHVVLVDGLALVVGLVGLEVVDPVVVTVVRERGERCLHVVDGLVAGLSTAASLLVVSVLEEEMFGIGQLEVDERDVAVLGERDESRAVLRETGDGEVTIATLQPQLDGLTVGFGDVGLGEVVELSLVASLETTEVLGRHIPAIETVFCKAMVCKSCASQVESTREPAAETSAKPSTRFVERHDDRCFDRSNHGSAPEKPGRTPHDAIATAQEVVADV